MRPSAWIQGAENGFQLNRIDRSDEYYMLYIEVQAEMFYVLSRLIIRSSKFLLNRKEESSDCDV